MKFFCVLEHAVSHQQLPSTQRARKDSLTEKLKIKIPFRGVKTCEETRIKVRITFRLFSPTSVSRRILNIADSPPPPSQLCGRETTLWFENSPVIFFLFFFFGKLSGLTHKKKSSKWAIDALKLCNSQKPYYFT